MCVILNIHKHMRKFILWLILVVALVLYAIGLSRVGAQVASPSYWLLQGSTLKPINSTYRIASSSISTSTPISKFINDVGYSTSTGGGGGVPSVNGISSAVNINGFNGITVSASSAINLVWGDVYGFAASSSVPTSTAGLVNNSGFTTLATVGANYVATSTLTAYNTAAQEYTVDAANWVSTTTIKNYLPSSTIAANYVSTSSMKSDILYTKREMQILARPGGTTIDVAGTYSPTITGNSTNVNNSVAPFIQYIAASSTALNFKASLSTSYTAIRGGWDPEIAFSMSAIAATSTRLWAGLFSAAPGSSTNPTISMAAFRYDDSSDTTPFWRMVTKDGSTINVMTSTIPFSTTTKTDLRIGIASTTGMVSFYWNNILQATTTTNVPASSTQLGFEISNTNLATSARGFWFDRAAIWYN
jgi:hypothetical protein